MKLAIVGWITVFGTVCFVLLGSASVARADLVVTEIFNSRLIRYDEVTGDVVPDWEIPAGSAGLQFPSGVTLDPSGQTLFVSSLNTGEILWYDLETGAPLPSPHEGERDGLFAVMPQTKGSELPPGPGPLRFGPNGNLYVSDNQGPSVRIFDGADGTLIGDAATGLFAAGGMTFDNEGNLFVADFALGDIHKVDTQGGQTLFASLGKDGPANPSGLLVTPTGTVLASDLSGNQVVEISADGTTGEQFAVIPPDIPEPLPPSATFPSNSPGDMLIAPDGTLLLAVLGITNPLHPDDFGDERGGIQRYDFAGNLIEVLVGGLTPEEGVPPISAMVLVPAVQPVPGDNDRNGTVGPEDYELWTQQFGQNVALGSGADGNADGVVGAADYVFWRNIVEGGDGNGSAAAVIPEPQTVIQLALVLVAALLPATRFRSAG